MRGAPTGRASRTSCRTYAVFGGWSKLPVVVSGEGCHVTDDRGRTYVDGLAGGAWGPLSGAFFVSSGSEAVVKPARQHHKANGEPGR